MKLQKIFISTEEKVRIYGEKNQFFSQFQLESDDSVKGIVVMSGKPNSFVAGADINMLKAAKSAEEAEALAR